MTVKTIALCIMGKSEADWLIPAACDLARGFGAHLTGIRPVETIVPPAVRASAYWPEPALFDWQIQESEEIRNRFEAVTRGESFGSEVRVQEASAIEATQFLLDSARAADVLVMGRGETGRSKAGERRLREVAIRGSGRPVVLLPRDRPLSGPAGRILIGWSPTREATRAAHDAVALLAPGATIDLLRVHSKVSSSDLVFDTRHDLAAALDRHGFVVNLVDRHAPAEEAGSELLRVARETGVDLVATGAYGHSRAYDFVIGAVTGYLLDHAELPVLLSK